MYTEGGFTIFSAPHLITLAVIITVSLCAAFFFRSQSDRRRNTAGLAFCLILTALDLIHYAAYDRLGELSVNAIPLHLCAMAIYICLAHSIFRADWLGQVLYALCLPGVWCALLFPDWTSYPILSYPSLHSFITHGMISAYVISQLASGRIRPRISALWKPVLFLAFAVPVSAAVNHFLKTNFLFISRPSPGSPLEWLSYLAGGSHALYLLFFAALALIVMTIMYLPYSIVRAASGSGRVKDSHS